MNKDRKKIVTIDGPAGAGKSTVGKLLAARLSYSYLDTGAIYRALALHVLELGMEGAREDQIGELAQNVSIDFSNDGGAFHIMLNGVDVTDEIRTPEIGMIASKISAFPSVRRALMGIQRAIGLNGGIVADGRDMGTVVFPEAEFKFYLDAKVSERAKRRYLELKEKNADAELATILEDIRKRDQQDMGREAAPLKPAEGAVTVDSTYMSVQEVLDRMLDVIGQRKPFS